jgi:HK97 family phage major capsid protein
MSVKTSPKRSERAKLVADARTIYARADAEKRPLNTEERAQWDKLMKAVDDLKQALDDEEKMDGAEDEDEREEFSDDGKEKKPRDQAADEDREVDEDVKEDEEGDEEEEYDDKERSRKFRKGARRSAGRRVKPGTALASRDLQRRGESRSNWQNRVRRNGVAYRTAFADFMLNGTAAVQRGIASRAIQADSDIVGGYLVAPQQFVADLILFVKDLVYLRQKGTIYTVNAAQSLGAPALDSDPADADWTSELATGNEDTAMAFGKRELHPHPLAKRLKVSKKLLRLSAIPAEALVRDRLGYKFAIAEEKAFYTGGGGNKPLGLFTASTMGISTNRDVTAGTTTSPTADGLITAKMTLKAQYQEVAEWFFHRNAVQLIMQLKDGMGQYLWKPGLEGGRPDLLLDLPLNMSEYVPNTFTTGLYYGVIGDPKFYWIADSEQMEIQRLDELYAETNQVGFIARRELDAMPVLEEAFVRLKLA